jgi:predicted DNA binding protein
VAALTDRQREVIETAFDLGYYEIPRKTTHADIATMLDLSGSTIDEHLRKAEAKLMEQLLS